MTEGLGDQALHDGRRKQPPQQHAEGWVVTVEIDGLSSCVWTQQEERSRGSGQIQKGNAWRGRRKQVSVRFEGAACFQEVEHENTGEL